MITQDQTRIQMLVRACSVTSVIFDSYNTMDYSPPGSSLHGILQAKYWRGLPFPPPGDFPNPRIERVSCVSPALQADSLPTEQPSKRWNVPMQCIRQKFCLKKKKKRPIGYFTIFLPVPEDISQPARQADVYDKPLFPHTGSHTLVGQLQSMLQSARKFFTCKF